MKLANPNSEVTVLQISRTDNLLQFTNAAGESAIAPHWVIKDQKGVPRNALEIAELLSQIDRNQATSLEITNGSIQLVTSKGKVAYRTVAEQEAARADLSTQHEAARTVLKTNFTPPAPVSSASQLRLTPIEELLAYEEEDRDSWKVTQSGYFTTVKDADQARDLLSKIIKLGRTDPSNGIYDQIRNIQGPTVLYVATDLGRDNDQVDFTTLNEATLKHMLAGIESMKQAVTPSIS